MFVVSRSSRGSADVESLHDDPVRVVDEVLQVLRDGECSVGVGAGPSGPAVRLAGLAAEAARSRSRAVPLAVRGFDDGAGRDAEAVLVLLAAVAGRRSQAGWEVVDALSAGDVAQEDLARRLGVSQQAVSQRLRAALWAPEQAGRRAAARLLLLAEGAGHEVPQGHGRDAR